MSWQIRWKKKEDRGRRVHRPISLVITGMRISISHLLLLGILMYTSCQAVEWQQTSPSIDTYHILKIISDGQGTLVMIEEGLDLYYSVAGSNEWSRSNRILNVSLNPSYPEVSAFFFNDQFLVYSGYPVVNQVYSSSNGKVFNGTTLSSPIGYGVFMLSNNGNPILVSYNSYQIFVSTDGLAWDIVPLSGGGIEFFSRPESSAGELETVLFIGSLIHESIYYITTNGYNYTAFNSSILFPDGSFANLVLFYDGAPGEIIALAVPYNFLWNISIYSSRDQGVSWSLVSSIPQYIPTSFFYLNGKYVACFYWSESNAAELLISTDLHTWTNITSKFWTFGIVTAQAVDNSACVFLYAGYKCTSDFQNWFTYNFTFAQSISNIFVMPDGSFVFEAVRNTAIPMWSWKFFSSTDGINFTLLSAAPFSESAYYFEQNGGYYFLDASGRDLYTTTNFQNWTHLNLKPPCAFQSVIMYEDEQWVGVCYTGFPFEVDVNIYHSSAPNEWVNVFTFNGTGILPPLYGFAYGAGIFVFQLHGDVYTSMDGIKWTVQKRFLPSNFTEVYFLNDLFFLISVVDEPIQYASKDGKSWTTITSLKNTNATVALTYSSTAKMYFALKYSGEIQASTDGIHWNNDDTYNLPTTEWVEAIEYNGDIWTATDVGGNFFVGH